MTPPIVPPQPPQPPPTTQLSKDQVDILKFLREEAEQNRKAQRDESDANRKLFLDTSKIVAIPLAVLLTLAGIFFYRDINTMKEAMKAEGEAEAKAEIKRMDQHIDDTLEERFKSENIQKTIQKAALDATSQQAPNLIKEVITPEVRKAVQDQSGTIRSVASQAAKDEVKGVLGPVVADVKLQTVVAHANADDAQSLDQLVTLAPTLKGPQEDLVIGVITNLKQHSKDAVSLDGNYPECADPNGAEYKAILTSPLASVRKSAVADCAFYMSMGQWVPRVPGKSVSAFAVMETIGPIWIGLAFNDPSLLVREEAIYGLNSLYRGSQDVPLNGFDLVDTTYLRTWWAKHQSDQAAFALVAYAEGSGDPRRVRYDEIGLYDEAEREAKVSPRNQALLEQLREQMRTYSATPRLSPPDLAKEMGRGCTDVQKDLSIRLTGFTKQPEQERVDGYGLLELQFLMANCTVSADGLMQIAEYGVATRSLGSRYAVVRIVNKSSGASLDRYQSKALEDWIRSHKSS